MKTFKSSMAKTNQEIKILVVEDDNSLREMYETKLKKEGFLTYTAIDGEEGLKKIKEIKPDVVILDLIMPKKNGFDVLTEINKNKSSQKPPIIVLSNLGLDDDIILAKSLGAKDYLVKSTLLLKDLVKKIKEYIV
jgi:DNA-binding response OmpR family regulator